MFFASPEVFIRSTGRSPTEFYLPRKRHPFPRVELFFWKQYAAAFQCFNKKKILYISACECRH